jgi:hypothetical protein
MSTLTADRAAAADPAEAVRQASELVAKAAALVADANREVIRQARAGERNWYAQADLAHLAAILGGQPDPEIRTLADQLAVVATAVGSPQARRAR